MFLKPEDAVKRRAIVYINKYHTCDKLCMYRPQVHRWFHNIPIVVQAELDRVNGSGKPPEAQCSFEYVSEKEICRAVWSTRNPLLQYVFKNVCVLAKMIESAWVPLNDFGVRHAKRLWMLKASLPVRVLGVSSSRDIQATTTYTFYEYVQKGCDFAKSYQKTHIYDTRVKRRWYVRLRHVTCEYTCASVSAYACMIIFMNIT